MKTRIIFKSLIFLSLFLLWYSCEKEEVFIGSIPTVKTLEVSVLSSNTIEGTIEIISNGGVEIKTYGYCVSTTPGASIPNTSGFYVNKGKIKFYVFDLLPNTTYYLRSFATNNKGTAYGDEITCKTPSEGTASDLDGNVYPTKAYGNQVWMKEALRSGRYGNGDSIGKNDILTRSNFSFWPPYTTERLYIKEKDIIHSYSLAKENQTHSPIQPRSVAVFQYSYRAITDARKVAPAGWHIPTKEEIEILFSNKVFQLECQHAGVPYPNSFIPYFLTGWYAKSDVYASICCIKDN